MCLAAYERGTASELEPSLGMRTGSIDRKAPDTVGLDTIFKINWNNGKKEVI